VKVTLKAAIVAVIVMALVGGGSAVAGSLVTSAKIADGTIQNRDIAEGTISLSRLSEGTQALIRQHAKDGVNGRDGVNGAGGRDGARGIQGQAGTAGRDGRDATIASGNWGIIDRNVIGSASAVLRSGPGAAPLGTGSLNLSVADGASKIAFGNEVDFAGLKISSISALGFSVYQTGENTSVSPANLPNMSLEVNPGVAGKTYSSLVYNPAPVQPGQWSTVDATQGAGWYFTNAAVAAATGCGQGAGQKFCTLDEIKAVAPDAYVTYSLGIAKGRDSAWHGAVDAVRVNDRVFDFEETGVSSHAAS
jgi:hypothetical protein